MLTAELICQVTPRFWKHVAVGHPNVCWRWTAHLNPKGYGNFKVKSRPHGAHRIAMMIHLGRPIDGQENVLHRCDNPACVNPGHLFLGTRKDNMQDMVSKGRHKTPFKGGRAAAKVTPEQVAEIRALADGVSRKVLAAKYGLTADSISRIVCRRTHA